MTLMPSAQETNQKTNDVTSFLHVTAQEAVFLKANTNEQTHRIATKICETLRLTMKMFEGSRDAVVITDSHHHFIDVNPAFCAITGYSKTDILHQAPALLNSHYHDSQFYFALYRQLLTSEQWVGEIWIKCKNNNLLPLKLSLYSVKDEQGVITHFVGIFSDLSAHKSTENELSKLAHYDSLTGLANRAQFVERLQFTLDMAKRNRHQSALMLLDVDRFKLVNDTLGHQLGDELLVQVARRLKQCVREVDTVSRLGGDEFTIILGTIQSSENAAGVAKKILHALSTPFILNEREVFVSVSIGITVFPLDGDSVHLLIKNADTAMYHAKESGRNNYQYFSDTMNQKMLDELEMETNLRQAFKNNEFSLNYQPQFALKTQKLIGAEVLVRWHHPVLGWISPAVFIPYAEKSNLIIALGEWVLRTACMQAVSWQKTGLTLQPMSVNLSGMQLKQPDLLYKVAQILEETQFPAHLLELELTEGVLMANVEETITTLKKLKEMGIRLSIDDFGTGYSSLSYLKRFPIDTLKIDQSFIKEITTSSDDSAIASTIIAMAHNLRLNVIAEGVETIEQANILLDKDCDDVQGYFFSRPLCEADFCQLLTKMQAESV
ncbi:MAG TPA: diguanylate cyclase [Methylococcaceae bacterium]|nr:diguanylate cyclase [Methylococcaceae bacterium]